MQEARYLYRSRAGTIADAAYACIMLFFDGDIPNL